MHRFLLILTVALWSVQAFAPGKIKRGALRVLARHTGALEHGLRCLLLLMRAAPSQGAEIPEGLSRTKVSARVRRKASRFSLSLAQLAKGFARHGHDTSALAPKRREIAAPNTLPPRGPAASTPITDPADALLARLDAIRGVFADPHCHAARLAGILRDGGFTLRALKALIPTASLWQLTSHRAGSQSQVLPCPAPNTS